MVALFIRAGTRAFATFVDVDIFSKCRANRNTEKWGRRRFSLGRARRNYDKSGIIRERADTREKTKHM